MIGKAKAVPVVPLCEILQAMKRGNKQFKTIFSGEQPGKGQRRGRNNELLEKRNACLLARYYYYGHFTEKRYDAIIQHLSTEFFLSPVTIQDLVQDHVNYLHELKQLNPRRAYFESQWPHLVW